MKKLFFLFLLVLCTAVLASAQVYVDGYVRKDGTYVQPHYRSSPDGNPYNNYSYPGNTNPYTGRTATGNPSTYLDNYYSKTDKIYIKDSSGDNTAYALESNHHGRKTRYEIYSLQSEYIGHAILYRSGKCYRYDKDGNLVFYKRR